MEDAELSSVTTHSFSFHKPKKDNIHGDDLAFFVGIGGLGIKFLKLHIIRRSVNSLFDISTHPPLNYYIKELIGDEDQHTIPTSLSSSKAFGFLFTRLRLEERLRARYFKLTRVLEMDRFYKGSLTIKSNVGLVADLKQRLTDSRLTLLRNTVFGPWLQLTDTSSDPILVLLFLQCQYFPHQEREDEMWFNVNGHQLVYGVRDFCLITGLRFGDTPALQPVRDGFVRRVFQTSSPTVKKLKSVYETIRRDNDGFSDDEAVRICLMMMAETVFLGHQSAVRVPDTVLSLIEDLGQWNNFPWGSYVWEYTYRQMNGAIQKRGVLKRAMTMSGFLFAFKIWIVETFPVAAHYYTRQNRLPTGVGWDRQIVLNSKHAESIMRTDADPTFEEEQQDWLIESQVYWWSQMGTDSTDETDDENEPEEEPHEAPSYSYNRESPSHSYEHRSPHGDIPPAYSQGYFEPYWARLTTCENDIAFLKAENERRAAEDERRAKAYQDHETRLAQMESYFQNMRMPSSGHTGGQPGAAFFQDLVGGTTTAGPSSYVGHSSQMRPPQFSSTMGAPESAFHISQPTYEMDDQFSSSPATTT